MTTPTTQPPSVAVHTAAGERPPPAVPAISATTSPAAQRRGSETRTRPVDSITSLTAPVPQERPPVVTKEPPAVAKAPPVAARGDDDLMSQRQ